MHEMRPCTHSPGAVLWSLREEHSADKLKKERSGEKEEGGRREEGERKS